MAHDHKCDNESFPVNKHVLLIEKLKYRYTKDHRRIDLKSFKNQHGSNRYEIDGHYVEQQLLECTRSDTHKPHDNHHARQPLTYAEISSRVIKTPGHCIGIHGGPLSGKSQLCFRLAYDWAKPGDGVGVKPGDGIRAKPGDGVGAKPGDDAGAKPGDGIGAKPGDGAGAKPAFLFLLNINGETCQDTRSLSSYIQQTLLKTRSADLNEEELKQSLRDILQTGNDTLFIINDVRSEKLVRHSYVQDLLEKRICTRSSIIYVSSSSVVDQQEDGFDEIYELQYFNTQQLVEFFKDTFDYSNLQLKKYLEKLLVIPTFAWFIKTTYNRDNLFNVTEVFNRFFRTLGVYDELLRYGESEYERLQQTQRNADTAHQDDKNRSSEKESIAEELYRSSRIQEYLLAYHLSQMTSTESVHECLSKAKDEFEPENFELLLLHMCFLCKNTEVLKYLMEFASDSKSHHFVLRCVNEIQNESIMEKSEFTYPLKKLQSYCTDTCNIACLQALLVLSKIGLVDNVTVMHTTGHIPCELLTSILNNVESISLFATLNEASRNEKALQQLHTLFGSRSLECVYLNGFQDTDDKLIPFLAAKSIKMVNCHTALVAEILPRSKCYLEVLSEQTERTQDMIEWVNDQAKNSNNINTTNGPELHIRGQDLTVDKIKTYISKTPTAVVVATDQEEPTEEEMTLSQKLLQDNKFQTELRLQFAEEKMVVLKRSGNVISVCTDDVAKMEIYVESLGKILERGEILEVLSYPAHVKSFSCTYQFAKSKRIVSISCPVKDANKQTDGSQTTESTVMTIVCKSENEALTKESVFTQINRKLREDKKAPQHSYQQHLVRIVTDIVQIQHYSITMKHETRHVECGCKVTYEKEQVVLYLDNADTVSYCKELSLLDAFRIQRIVPTSPIHHGELLMLLRACVCNEVIDLLRITKACCKDEQQVEWLDKRLQFDDVTVEQHFTDILKIFEGVDVRDVYIKRWIFKHDPSEILNALINAKKKYLLKEVKFENWR